MNFGLEIKKKNPKVISLLGCWINIHIYTYTSLKVESPASSPSRISGAVHLIGKHPWKTTNKRLPYKTYVPFFQSDLKKNMKLHNVNMLKCEKKATFVVPL